LSGPPPAYAPAGGAKNRNGSTRGTTIVEVVTVMLVVSIITRIVVPQMQDILTRARATEIRASFGVVEEAATRLSVQNNRWPEDADAGVVPPELMGRLPRGFSFERDRYQLDWENWVLPEGMPGDSTVRRLIGISVTTSDRSLGLALMGMIPLNSKFTLGETYTFIFATQ
jgi:hypothetical protein